MTERKASMGDKVYRGDVVKFIRNNISLGTFMKRTVKAADEACWDLCDKLNYVPAIEEKPEPHWIPVDLENNKPQLEEWVLVSSDGYVMQDCIVERGGEKIWYHGGNIQADDRYMPLPEPYKGDAE